MGTLTRAIAKPVLLWALHFTAIYALISAACAPRALLEPAHLVTTAAVLTALAAMIGAGVILTDPIFQGLAISLLFGLVSSTALTVLVIPAIYRLAKT